MNFTHSCVLGASLWIGAGAALAKPRELPPSKTAPTFSNPTQGYALWLPTKPTQSSRSQQLGNKTATFRIATASAPPLTFVVVSARLPAGMRVPSASRQLDSVQTGFMIPAKNAGFSLLSSQDLRLNGVPGRELVVGSKAQANQLRVRLFFKAPMSYQVMAVGPKKPTSAQKAQINRVLDSFRILPVGGAR